MFDDDGSPVHLPIGDSIDLHTFQPRDVVDVADDYLREAQVAGFTVVRLIHGRGRGVQRAAIHRLLRTHPVVESFWDAPEAHLGATLVRLKPPASDRRAPEPGS